MCVVKVIVNDLNIVKYIFGRVASRLLKVVLVLRVLNVLVSIGFNDAVLG